VIRLRRTVDVEGDCDELDFECGWCARFVVEGAQFCSPSCAEKTAEYDAQHATPAPTPVLTPVVEVAPVALRRQSTVLVRVLAGIATVAVVAPVTLVGIARFSHDDHVPQVPASVWRVVDSQCLNGRVQQGIDTGRPDGLLLAHDTGTTC
jgi:hypothetical protein